MIRIRDSFFRKNLYMSPEILDPVLLRTDYPDLELHASGKVRDVYSLDADHLLFVATDRISAFDYVLATGIPHKGRVLTQISLFWFDFLKDIVPNHFVTADVTRYPSAVQKYADELRGRSMMVMRAEMFPVECVARGYLSGSGWKEYKATGTVCGIKLPTGLKESDQLPEPIFTPATKATTGHDINISFEEMCKLVDPELSRQLRDLTLGIYKKAADYARQRGIIIADTKFEFGQTAKGITLADEVLTPGFLALLAGRLVPTGQSAGFLRQAVCKGLPRRNSLEQTTAGACPPPGRCATDERKVPRGLSSVDGTRTGDLDCVL